MPCCYTERLLGFNSWSIDLSYNVKYKLTIVSLTKRFVLPGIAPRSTSFGWSHSSNAVSWLMKEPGTAALNSRPAFYEEPEPDIVDMIRKSETRGFHATVTEIKSLAFEYAAAIKIIVHFYVQTKWLD